MKKLCIDEIKMITTGAADVRFEDGAFKFDKCTEKQINAWYAVNDTLGMRARTTTGIRLDFHTDSESFGFKVASGGKFEVLIDGVLRSRFTPKDGDEISVPLLDMTGKRKESFRVTLVFPSHSIGSLEYVSVDDGAYVKPHEYSTKMLFIGDSITQGHNSYYDTLSYAWRVSLYYNASSIINGIGGAFYEPETFDVPDFDPDTVIIAYGTNDATRFPKFGDMHVRVKGYLDFVKNAYGDKRVIVISPIWRATADGKNMGEDFERKRAMVENEAHVRGFEVLSGLSLVPPLNEMFADRYLHPNDLGFGVYAENVIKYINDFKK